ncbi:hypothetical protein ACJMK2_026483, partial [Sinanodonta woodiana]
MSRIANKTETFLYNGNALVAVWSKSNTEHGNERVAHDSYGNIWMHQVQVSDNALYTVVQTIDGNHSSVLYDVRLIVLVAPEKSCQPQINRVGDTLTASLETGAACGNPEAKAYWLNNPYLSLENKTMAKLSPGREAGTYYACIETLALRCARHLKPLDFCSSLTIEESMAF